MNRRQFVRGALAAGAVGVTGTALLPTDLAAQAPASGSTPQDFGAKGDGKTDDTAAFEKALSSKIGALHIPRGVYRITRPVRVELTSRGTTSITGDGSGRIEMHGAGPALHFVGSHDGTADPSGFRDAIWELERMPLVGGFGIRGMHAEAIGIRLEKTMQTTISNLLVRRCAIGLHLAGRNRNLVVTHSHFYHNDQIGIFFDEVNLHQVILNTNHISYNRRAGILVQGGEIRNLQIVGNDIEYNYDEKLDNCADILIDSRKGTSSCRECTIVGNTIQARPSPGGANIRFLGNKAFRTGGMSAVTGNLIGNQTVNMQFADCRNLSISGNAIYSAVDRTLIMERCANVTCGDNSIDWNPSPPNKKYVDGIRFEDCDAVNLSGTIIENCFQGSKEKGGTIEISRCRDVSVSDCQILDSKYRGIVIEDSKRCHVTGSRIIDRRPKQKMIEPVAITGGGDHWIEGNIISHRLPKWKGVRVGENHEVDPT